MSLQPKAGYKNIPVITVYPDEVIVTLHSKEVCRRLQTEPTLNPKQFSNLIDILKRDYPMHSFKAPVNGPGIKALVVEIYRIGLYTANGYNFYINITGGGTFRVEYGYLLPKRRTEYQFDLSKLWTVSNKDFY